MARRFTDSSKWVDDWFGDLEQGCKLAWIYIVDTCTPAGRWRKSLRSLNFHCDTTFTPESLKNVFDGRLLDYGKFFFIPKFLSYQYPRGLNSNKPAIVSVRDEILEYRLDGIVRESLGSEYLLVNDYPNDYLMIKDKDKDKDKDTITTITTKTLIDEIVEYWNNTELPKCKLINNTRRDLLKIRLRSKHFKENWKAAIDKLNASKFAKGSGNTGWKADIDWFIKNDNNYLKAWEGKYDGKELGFYDKL